MAALAGRTILVTGGTSGTGLAGAAAWHRLGATVVIGTRSGERYEDVARQLGNQRVVPLVADLSDIASIERGLASLDEAGIRLTDVVNCAAGGLEPLLRPLLRAVANIRRQPSGRERKAALDMHREALARLVAETAPAALRVNFVGPQRLISRLLPALPDGARIVTYSSIMSAALESGACPIFYRSVAESKVAMELWLAEAAGSWIRRAIRPVVLVGHLVADTSTGALIDRNLVPLLTAADQEEFRFSYVSTADMTAVVTGLLTEAPQPGEGLRRLFVVAPAFPTAELDPRVLAVVGRFPL